MKTAKKKNSSYLIARRALILSGAGLLVFSLQSVALWLPWRWAYGFAANATVWPVLQVSAELLVIGIAIWLWGAHIRRVAVVYGVLAVISMVPTIGMLATVQLYAQERGIKTSALAQINVFRRASASDEAIVRYGSAGQTDLYLSSYLAPRSDGVRLPVVVYVHGGGWSGGSRTENSDFFRWFNTQGYQVFSIDYRVARDDYASYRDAPRDVACALSWLRSVKTHYDIDLSRVTLMGDSAGGQLALRAAYGVKNNDVRSSCGGVPVIPSKVIGIVPAIDFRELYDDPKLGPTSRANVVRFLGGTPDTVPGAYDESSIITHVKADLQPTLIINAGTDTLVSPRSGEALAVKLKEAGVRVEQYTLPYAVHSYWINPGGSQNQTARGLIERFMEKR